MSDTTIHINHNGFREYDARWLYPDDINLAGIKNLGCGLGSQIISISSDTPMLLFASLSISSKIIAHDGLLLLITQNHSLLAMGF